MNRTNERRRFIILTDQRSGSNHLEDLLGSHRAVKIAGELFNPSHDHNSRNNPLPEKLRGLRKRDPIAYLEAFFEQPFDESITHVGFRLFHDHARCRTERTIWANLRRTKDLQVVHLKRRNLLRNLLSLKLAMRSDNWQRMEGTPPVRYEPLRIEYQEVIAHIRARERSFARGKRFFRRHRRAEILYEDLERDQESQLAALLRFLGLPPQPLASSSRKQNQQSTRELIENHAELEARFRHTRWHEFFQD
ncbi:MAG: hypothetical protein CMJ22_08725 [Phycisphaerae bacterium]|nr:hypothetical protein [Phycisphaerae bacterium]